MVVIERSRKVDLLRLEPVLAILRAAIWSGRLGGENPVSVMLIAPQESAKTQCLLFFRGTPTIRYKGDLTSRGLRPHKKEIEQGIVRHIVLLDFIRILAHPQHTRDRTLQTMAALMEEGETEVADAGGTDTWEGLPRVGFLMGLTTDFFHRRKGGWRGTGFLTRFLPVSFRYTNKTRRDIHEAIALGLKEPHPEPESIPKLQGGVTLPVEHARAIMVRADQLGQEMETYGFRYHKAMRRLAMARAMSERRGTVDESDVAAVLSWSDFFRLTEVEL